MADIFDEVNEDLKKDKIMQLWKKYRNLIISFLIVLLIVIISYQSYTYIINKKNLNSADIFHSASNSENFLDNVMEKEDQLNKGYKMLTLFKLANEYSKNDQKDLASETYSKVYKNNDYDEFYRDIALILSILNGKKVDNEKLEYLEKLIQKDSSLKGLSLEIQASILLEEGDFEGAIKKFDAISKLTEISPIQRKRISDLLMILKAD